MEKKVVQKKKETLLELREKGKKEALEINAMKAHGKIMGMDTFSWVNPNTDQLSSVLASFPFQIIWIATPLQLKKCLNIHNELANKIETVILHNTSKSEINEESFFRIKNRITVQNSKDALMIMNAVKKKKCAFLFTTEGVNAKRDKNEFEKFIESYK